MCVYVCLRANEKEGWLRNENWCNSIMATFDWTSSIRHFWRGEHYMVHNWIIMRQYASVWCGSINPLNRYLQLTIFNAFELLALFVQGDQCPNTVVLALFHLGDHAARRIQTLVRDLVKPSGLGSWPTSFAYLVRPHRHCLLVRRHFFSVGSSSSDYTYMFLDF